MGAYRIASHRRVVSRAPLARHSRVTRASRTHAPTPLMTMMTTTRRDDDTAATPCVAVAAVYHVGGVVRSQTVETRAIGLLDVGLLTPGQGMPGT